MNTPTFQQWTTALFLSAALLACSSPKSNPPAAEDPPDAGPADVQEPQDIQPQDAPQEDAAPPDASEDAPEEDLGPPPPEGFVQIRVLLDGQPAPDTTIVQGGLGGKWLTDDQGLAVVPARTEVEGELLFLASHPEARIRRGEFVPGETQRLTIGLTRYDASDNPEYAFQDPGEPERRPNTSQCGHCHQTINDAWYGSPHRTSASNRTVQDMYAGTASGLLSQETCTQAGGRWLPGPEPGTGNRVARCYLGDGALPALNPEDCTEGPCSSQADQFGECADCHAPAINGKLGGRGLHEARDLAYKYGVSCNVCHQVDQVDLDQPPGVAGRLKITRPSEEASIALGAGGFLPLPFGPSHDSPNPRMGSVQRDHFRSGLICAGCHQHVSQVLVEGQQADPERWPDGRLPVQTTYEEWRTGALGEATRCPSCHMPPDPTVANGADLQRFPLANVGVQGGWYRPAGQVREHSWVGPRQPRARMLQMAAALFVNKTLEGDTLSVEVRTRNVGAGHAIPTGEPMRSILLHVEAWCGLEPLQATGGDVIPDFGGALDRRTADQDWTRWPGAQPGDVIRVIRRTGAHHDYDGFGPFEGQRLTPEQKGMPVEHYVGSATVTEVQGDVVTLDQALPQGDVAYRTKPGLRQGESLAGAPGFGFAKVMVGADGRRMVPHFLAVDVASDNRLMPQQSWTTQHTFRSPCPEPEVQATLIYRPYPLELANQRRWELGEEVMEEVRK